jgi:hypothetical protein
MMGQLLDPQSADRPSLVWVKGKMGPGHWVRGQHEHLLIARRGDFPTLKTEHRPPS